MATKQVTIVVEGSDQPERKVDLIPETTVGEALVKAGLDPDELHMLSLDSTRLLANDEDLYAMTDPGDKLSVSAPMDAGTATLLVLGITVAAGVLFIRVWVKMQDTIEPHLRSWESWIVARLPRTRRVSRPSSRRPKFVQKVLRRVPVPMSSSPVSLDRWLRRNGWRVNTDACHGRFRTGFGTFPGKVVPRDGNYEVYLRNPPSWMLSGRFSECVISKGRGWYWIHQHRHLGDLVATIRGTEVFLMQKYAEHRRCA